MNSDKMPTPEKSGAEDKIEVEKDRGSYANENNPDGESAFWRQRESTVPYATDGPVSFVEPAYIAGYQGYNQYGSDIPQNADKSGQTPENEGNRVKNSSESDQTFKIPAIPIPPIPL